MSAYRALSLYAFLICNALLAASASLWALTAIHKRAPPSHDRWDQGPRAQTGLIIPVQVDLAERLTDEAVNALVSLADPFSSTFGQYWSASDVTAAFSLPVDEIKAVLDWVEEPANLPRSEILLSPCLCRIDFNITARALETLHGTEYFICTHKTSGDTSLACLEYRVPENLLESIDYIIPTVFPVHGPAVPALLKTDDHLDPLIWILSFPSATLVATPCQRGSRG